MFKDLKILIALLFKQQTIVGEHPAFPVAEEWLNYYASMVLTTM